MNPSPPCQTPDGAGARRPVTAVLVSVHPYPSPQAVPLAAAFLQSYLAVDEELVQNVSVVLLDFYRGDPVEACVAAISRKNPDAVGFSVYLWNRQLCADVAQALKERPAPPVLFAGGPEPTADHRRMLEAGQFDFIIRGEGEIPFLRAMARLYEGVGFEGIPGVVTAGNDTAHPETAEAELLDTLPSPYLSGTLDLSRYPGVLWQLSRGCAFRCDFCYDHRSTGHPRRFSFQRSAAELKLFAARGVSQIFVLDSTFNQDQKRAKDILRLIAKVAPHIHFHFEARSEFIDREMARLFARINCSVQVGLQSANVSVQKTVHRSFDPRDFTAKISLLNQEGVIFGFDLMYGLPGDSLSGFRYSLDFALSLLPNHLDIFPLAVLPGTKLAAEAATLGLVHHSSSPYTLTESPTFPAADMEAAAQLAAATDIFYSRGKAVAWFSAIVTPLGLHPSDFLAQFYQWLQRKEGNLPDERRYGDTDIWKMQREFLQHVYAVHHMEMLLPAALDLVDYHYHYAAALLTPAPDLPTDRDLEQMDLLSADFVLPPSTRLATFHYEILDILESGDVNLNEFVECFSPTGSQAAIYPRAGEVFTESLDPRYYDLLCRFTTPSTAGPILSHVSLSTEEASSFLEFAAAEGIITPFSPTNTKSK